jgi:hypothetical protein
MFARSKKSCTASGLSGTQTCNSSGAWSACMTTTYSWSSTWTDSTSCSASCGGGSKTQYKACVSSTGAVVADSNCSGTKPTQSVACNTMACPCDTTERQAIPSGYAGSGAYPIASTTLPKRKLVGTSCLTLQQKTYGPVVRSANIDLPNSVRIQNVQSQNSTSCGRGEYGVRQPTQFWMRGGCRSTWTVTYWVYE